MQWPARGQKFRGSSSQHTSFNQRVFDSFHSLYSFNLLPRGLSGRDAAYDVSDQASGICAVFVPLRRSTPTLHNPGTTTTALHSTLQIRTTLRED